MTQNWTFFQYDRKNPEPSKKWPTEPNPPRKKNDPKNVQKKSEIFFLKNNSTNWTF